MPQCHGRRPGAISGSEGGETGVTITLSADARRSLDAICDTFVPGENGLPSATDIGVPEVILQAIGGNPSEAVRDGFAGVLEGWDTGVSDLSKDEREAALLSLCDSDEVMQRAAFQGLRKLTMVMYYTLPWQGEGPNPVDEAIGYPGPLGPPKDPPPKKIKPLEISGDTELDCDVRLYLGGGGVPTPDQSIGLLAGHCLGGGTTVNYTWCFRPPDHVRRDWVDRFGLDDWDS